MRVEAEERVLEDAADETHVAPAVEVAGEAEEQRKGDACVER